MSLEHLMLRLGAAPGGTAKTCHYCKSTILVATDDPPFVPDRPWRLAGMKDLHQFVESLGEETREWVLVLFVDRGMGLLGVDTLDRGSISGARVDAGLIITRGRLLGAAAFILVHNHPSGDSTPSVADIAVTRRLQETTMYCDLHMLTHVVVTAQGIATVGIW